ncbi:MAG: NADH-quinone oxidoreductase subunit N [Bacteroidota bacterium]
MDQQFQEIVQQQLADLSQSLSYLWGEYSLLIAIVLLLFLEILRKKDHSLLFILLAMGGLLTNLFFQGFDTNTLLFEGNLQKDALSSFGKYLFAGSGIVCLLFLLVERGRKQVQDKGAEYPLILLGLILGLNFLSMSLNLLYLYLSLEVVSICSYILAAWQDRGSQQAESALKYIIFGATASGIMLYGISWLYGFTGSLNPASEGFIAALEQIPIEALILSFSLIFAGFLFKLAAFPFHFWAPDIYQGIPYSLAAFFSVAPKVAAFIALYRFLEIFQDSQFYPYLTFILGSLALLSMTVGNLLALRQKNIKRLLAFSGIAHSGFMLLALIGLKGLGGPSLLFYLFVYTLLNLSAFILADHFSELSASEEFIDWGQVGKQGGIAGVLFAIAMAGLIGLPPTAGFTAKWYVFLSLFEQSQGDSSTFWIILLLGAIINTLISLYYYLIPLIYLYFRKQKLEKILPQNQSFLLIPAIISIPLLVLGTYGFDKFLNLMQEILWNS